MIPDLDIPADIDFTFDYTLMPVSEALAAGAPVYTAERASPQGLKDDMIEALDWPRITLDTIGLDLLRDVECRNPGLLIEDFCDDQDGFLIEELCPHISLSFAVSPALLHARSGDFILTNDDNSISFPGLHVQAWSYRTHEVHLDSAGVIFINPRTGDLSTVGMMSGYNILDRSGMLIAALAVLASPEEYGMRVSEGRLRRLMHS